MSEHGFLLVDKPKGWTSFDVCGRLRRIFGIKRVGHTGTLDPFATGLLVVALGKATKLIPFFEKDVKTYETMIRFGVMSDTLDPEGIVTTQEGKVQAVKGAEIEKVLSEVFMGKITQIPPKYSALKINGKKMYELARAGEEFEVKPRETEIHAVELLKLEYPDARIRITASAGFYVRSFARDLAEVLGTCGICWELRRTEVGDISISTNKFTVYQQNQLKEGNRSDFALIDPSEILALPSYEIKTERLDDFHCGRAFPFESDQVLTQVDLDASQRIPFLIRHEAKTIGLAVLQFEKLHPRTVF